MRPALAALLILAACGGHTAAPDAGMDAHVAIDAGPPIVCVGNPPECSLLDMTNCPTIAGCHESECGGYPITCAMLRDSASCVAQVGCSWIGSACAGMAAACDGFGSDVTCNAQSGCVWSVPGCRGTASRCETRGADECTAQPGCHPPAVDAGVGSRDAQPVVCTIDGGLPPGCSAPPPPPDVVGCNPSTGIECDGDWSDRCVPACSSDQCCSPRDGSFQCVPREPDGSCPAADIFIDASRIDGLYTVEEQMFAPDDCALVEGCVNAPGMRRLLRFDTFTPNVGDADLYLGPVPAAGVTSGPFVWSPCHGHHHFASYASYELLSADGCCLATSGHKQAFCLTDLEHYLPDVGSVGPSYSCANQGIQRGWLDVYSAGLTCQWIDVTDVPSGDYLLRIRLNVQHILLESSYDNNEVVVPVTLP